MRVATYLLMGISLMVSMIVLNVGGYIRESDVKLEIYVDTIAGWVDSIMMCEYVKGKEILTPEENRQIFMQELAAEGIYVKHMPTSIFPYTVKLYMRPEWILCKSGRVWLDSLRKRTELSVDRSYGQLLRLCKVFWGFFILNVGLFFITFVATTNLPRIHYDTVRLLKFWGIPSHKITLHLWRVEGIRLILAILCLFGVLYFAYFFYLPDFVWLKFLPIKYSLFVVICWIAGFQIGINRLYWED